MSNKNFRIRNTRGYYIALVLCAAAIGISGYLYYRNANDPDARLSGPDATVGGTLSPEDDVPTGGKPSGPTEPSGEKPTAPQTGRKTLKTAAPVAGETVAEYAMDCLCYNETTRDWRVHNGVDIAAEAGTEVRAAAEGTVYTVFEDETMGTTVVIRHENGYTTQYASLQKEVSVKPGDHVELGQAIGTVGTTALLECAIGEHVHFSVTCDDAPVDPADFLKSE